MKNASVQELRQSGLDARRHLDEVARAQASLRIQRRFLNSNLFYRASKIACYIASPFEVDTSLIFERAWRAGKRIYAPVIDRNGSMRFVETHPDTRLVRNRFGLWEPEFGDGILAQNLRIVVTPTVAFDASKERIGMGGGFYDRAFRTLKAKRRWLPNKLVGFAFDCQKVEKIPANPWDIPLYRIITESSKTL